MFNGEIIAVSLVEALLDWVYQLGSSFLYLEILLKRCFKVVLSFWFQSFDFLFSGPLLFASKLQVL